MRTRRSASSTRPAIFHAAAGRLLQRIAAPSLVNRWPYPLITGFVVQQTESPVTGARPAPVPPPTPADGLDLRNLSYAVQWWLFAMFGLWLWWRLVRDDHRGRLAPGPAVIEPVSKVQV